MVHRTGNHSSLALGFGVATTAGTRDILLSIWTGQRVIAVISSIHVPRWHGALTSTHLLPIPGFWLGLPNRQEHRLTMPATRQDTGPKIIDRIHFQLPSWVLSTIIHQQNESTPWGVWVGFMQLGCLIVVKLSGAKWEKSDPLSLTWRVKHIYKFQTS